MWCSASLEEFADRFYSRIAAFGRVRSLVARSETPELGLRELVETEVKVMIRPQRLRCMCGMTSRAKYTVLMKFASFKELASLFWTSMVKCFFNPGSPLNISITACRGVCSMVGCCWAIATLAIIHMIANAALALLLNIVVLLLTL